MARRRNYKRKRGNYGKGTGYRRAIARQIQNAVPRPLRTQLVRMVYKNAMELIPALIGSTQPALGCTIAVNKPHHILYSPMFVGSPQETWFSTLAASGTMPHLATWTALYNKYLVRGCKVSITFRTAAGSVTSDRSGKICLIRHGGGGDINQYTTWQGIRDNNQYTKIGNVSASTTTMNQVSLSMGYSPTRSAAIRKGALTANPDLQGDVSNPASPAAPALDEYISIAYVSPYQNATTGAYTMPSGTLEVCIEQVVQFLDPKQSTAQQPMSG